MTNKRYFYTDPLAAAWMIKHFGLRIIAGMPNYPMEYSDEGEFLLRFVTEAVTFEPFEDKLYVHPDSLPLLEPQVRDTCDVIEDEWNVVHRVNDAYALKAFKGGWKLDKIIQRGGIAFMWPESEDA